MLADEHADTNAGHIEAVEEGLYVVVDLHPLSLALPLEDALRNGGDDAVVPPLDLLQGVCKFGVVGTQLWRPFLAVVCSGEVSPARRCALVVLPVAVAIAVLGRRAVLALLYAGVLRRLQQRRCALGRLQQPVFDFGGEVRPRQLDEFLRACESRVRAAGCTTHEHTSNDCAYQSRTRHIEGISLSPSGRSLSSCTRCANRMGSSSERNCDARKRVPVDGFSPNCTIWRSDTPAITSDTAITWTVVNRTYQLPGSCCSAARTLARTCSRSCAITHLDGVHQLLRPFPRHGCSCSRPSGPCR